MENQVFFYLLDLLWRLVLGIFFCALVHIRKRHREKFPLPSKKWLIFLKEPLEWRFL